MTESRQKKGTDGPETVSWVPGSQKLYALIEWIGVFRRIYEKMFSTSPEV